MTTKITDKPAKVNLNLDALESEAEVGPFVFVAGGQRFVVQDIQDHDWQELLGFDGSSPESSIRVLLGDEQFAKLEKLKGVSMRSLNVLLRSINEHFGLGTDPEGDASPGS